MKHFITQFFILFVTITSVGLLFQSCNEDDDGELPVVEAGFTHTISAETGKVTFINTSENADSYVWEFGDGTTSTEIDPIHTYNTGVYIISLEASNIAGATDTYQDTITINIPIPVTIPFNFDEQNVVYEPTVFNGANFSIIENPDPSGSNATNSKVGAITNSGANWEGLFFDLGAPLDLVNDMSISMDVWSTTPIPVLLKLEQGTGADAETTANHSGSGWEELLFTFNSSEAYARFTLFIDGPGNSAGTFYIDNIAQVATVDLTAPVITLNGDSTIELYVGDTFTDPGVTATDNIDGDITANVVVGGDTVDTSVEGTYIITYNVSDAAGNSATEATRTVTVVPAPTQPTMGAPIPTQNAANVISVYSDTYPNIPIDTFDPNWGQSGHTLVNPTFDPGDGNFALAYPNFNYQGTQFSGAQDVSSMDMIHIDLWTLNATDVKFTIISASSGEFLVSLTPINTGEWNSYDIPLSDFQGVGLTDIFQLKFDGQGGTSPSDIWLDNIYFYHSQGGGGSTGCTGNLTPATSLPLNFESCETIDATLNFGSGLTTNHIANPVQGGINTSDYVFEIIKEAGADFYAGVQNNFSSTFDLSNPNHVFKMKIYSSKANVPFRIEVAQDDPNVGNPPPQFVTVTDANTWTEVSFTFSNMPAPTSYFRLVIKPDNDSADSPITETGTYYIDDIQLIQ